MAAVKKCHSTFYMFSLAENIQTSDTQYFYFSFGICQFWLDSLKFNYIFNFTILLWNYKIS